jgi:hypothetical protein
MADLTLDDIPPALLEEAVSARLREIRDSKREERMRAMGRFGDPMPETGAFRAISEGRYRRKMRPKIMLEDRGFVPAALRHWRQVHNLTARQARRGSVTARGRARGVIGSRASSRRRIGRCWRSSPRPGWATGSTTSAPASAGCC